MGSGIGYGTTLERGTVREVGETGYTVASDERPGVVTPPLRSASGSWQAGDRVIFFLFPNGEGKILCGA